MIINTFNSNNSNIPKIKTQYQLIMTTITIRFWKFEPIIKIPVATNHTFFAVIIFSNISFFLHLNQFYGTITFVRSIYQNEKINYHQDITSFSCTPYVLILILKYLSLYYKLIKLSVLVQMVLYFSNSSS